MKKIYLAGAMSARRDRGVRWRKQITPFLQKKNFEVLDPTVEEERYNHFLQDHKVKNFPELKAKDKEAYADLMKLVEVHDLALIDQADIIIVYLDPPAFKSDGTIAEIRHAVKQKKEIWTVLKVPYVKIPGWTFWRIVEHTRVFFSFTDLKAYVKEL